MTKSKYNSVRTIDLSQDVIDALLREHERQEKAKPIYDDLYTTLYKGGIGHINTVWGTKTSRGPCRSINI